MRWSVLTVYLRITCTKMGKSGQEEVEWVVRLTLQKGRRRCRQPRAWKKPLVEIEITVYGGGRNVRVV